MTHILRRVIVVIAVLFVSGAELIGQQSAARPISDFVWAAFQCSQYAALQGNNQEAQRLFSVGYGAGLRLIDGTLKKSISGLDIQLRAPLGAMDVNSGPTPDFIVGRIYTLAIENAYEDVLKNDSRGNLLPEEDWAYLADDERRIAGDRFRSRHCFQLK